MHDEMNQEDSEQNEVDGMKKGAYLCMVYSVLVVMCLLQRSINVSKAMDKEALLQLAYQHTVPRPQRKYRANRRGLAMAAKQRKRASALNLLNFNDESTSRTYTVYACCYIVVLLHKNTMIS